MSISFFFLAGIIHTMDYHWSVQYMPSARVFCLVWAAITACIFVTQVFVSIDDVFIAAWSSHSRVTYFVYALHVLRTSWLHARVMLLSYRRGFLFLIRHLFLHDGWTQALSPKNYFIISYSGDWRFIFVQSSLWLRKHIVSFLFSDTTIFVDQGSRGASWFVRSSSVHNLLFGTCVFAVARAVLNTRSFFLEFILPADEFHFYRCHFSTGFVRLSFFLQGGCYMQRFVLSWFSSIGISRSHFHRGCARFSKFRRV